MSEIVYLNEPEIRYAELFRFALSEPDNKARLAAIRQVRFEVVGIRLGQLKVDFDEHWPEDPRNRALVNWSLTSEAERQEASFAFSELGKRYEASLERKINIAEQIGRFIYLSIVDGKFEGVQNQTGILSQVGDQGRKDKVSGARDKDTLRKIWSVYKGVVHFGMAIDVLEGAPEHGGDLLHLAADFQRSLSRHCPKGTTSPYVDPACQISFVASSRLYGPRFLDRGLPFDVA